MTPGLAAWVIQRFAAVVLLVAVPLKILSGWAVVGKLSWARSLRTIHTNALLDILIISAVTFHALFGVRVLLIDLGRVRAAQVLTIPFGIVGLLITGWAFSVAL